MSAEIVAADDDQTIREILRFELDKSGYDPALFENGQACWDYLQSNSSPDLVISDVMMLGIDGIRHPYCPRRLRGGLSVREGFLYPR